MTLIETLSRTFLILIAIFAFMGGLLYFLATSIEPETLKRFTLREVEMLTGHPIEVGGRFDISWSLVPIVKMNDVKLNLNPNSDTAIQIEAKKITLHLDLWPLLKTWKGPESSRDIDIDSFKMDKVRIKAKNLNEAYDIDSLSGQLKNNSLTKLEFNLHKNKTDLSGKVDLEKNRVLGHLTSNYFDTNDFPTLSQDLPLLFPAPSTSKKQFNIDIKSLQTSSILLHQTKLIAKIEKEKIILSPIHTIMADGEVQGSIIIHNNETQIHLQAKNFLLEKLLIQLNGQSKLTGGKTQMTLFASGKGTSIDEIIDTLTGRAFFVMQEAVLKDVEFKTSVSQIFLQIFNAFNSKRHKHTHIQCAVLRLNLQNGLAHAINNFGLETPEFNIWGTGKLNLKTKAINAELVNKPKARLRVEIGQFAKYVNIKGTLDNPQVSFNPKGLIQEGISIVTGIFTGGVSAIAEQLLKVSENNSSACQSIINKKSEDIKD